jgi:SAM-dependent methyltransferase
MAPFPLPELTELWDPRPASEAKASPIPNACNIPLDELERRVSELPPRGAEVEIAASGELLIESSEALARLGRKPRLSPDNHRLTVSPARTIAKSRLWRPNRFLESLMPNLAAIQEKALDLGCGAGRESLLMASWGWRVVGVDVLPDALEIARGMETKYAHPDAPRVDWLCFDLEAGGLPPGGPFGLVTSFRYLNRALIRRTRELLVPGGSIVAETFTETHRREFGKPRRAEFVLKQGELRELVSGLAVLEYEEGWHEGAHTARIWARKLA